VSIPVNSQESAALAALVRARWAGGFATTIYVDGQFAPAHGRERLEVVNPANARTIATIAAGDQHDVSLAVEAARAARTAPRMAGSTGADRAVWLRRLADLIEDEADQLARLLTAENGLTLVSSRTSVTKSAGAYRYFAGLAETLVSEERRGSAGAHAIVRREPVGVAALIVPWNGPQSLLSWKLAPALAAGCTVVIKPSPETTLDGFFLMELIDRSGIPAGVVNLVPGGASTGQLLVSHPGVDKVAFTGSTGAGRAIAIECAKRMIPATLELGGKSAAIILDDADIDSFAGQVVAVCSPNAGQVCRACTRVLVPQAMYERAVEVVTAAMQSVVVGDPADPQSGFGPLVSARQRDRVEEFVRIGVAEGATLVTGGRRLHELGPGYYYAPTVFRDVTNDMRIAREEIFGPVVVIMAYDNDDEAVRIANDSDFGLGGFIYTADIERGTELARRIESGSVGVNYAAMTMEAPFGGYKQSGLGKELGPEGLDAYLNTKTIYRPGA
jgi:aldehyde dehydrogenase (NAD+)